LVSPILFHVTSTSITIREFIWWCANSWITCNHRASGKSEGGNLGATAGVGIVATTLAGTATGNTDTGVGVGATITAGVGTTVIVGTVTATGGVEITAGVGVGVVVSGLVALIDL
jgi:hypothetical protein